MSLRNALNKPIIERQARTEVSSISSTRVQDGTTRLIDVLTPDGVDRRRHQMVQVGDSYMTTLELRGFPPTLPLAWLTSAMQPQHSSGEG